MKNKSLFNKISLIISIIILFLILILSILSSFNRVGYLSDFKLISSKNNIYTYDFRIKYHSKVFRNSDIYGVYINSKNIINANRYIRKITINEAGSPFGKLESNKKINGNIDNIVYTLKLKKSIIILSLVLVMILLLHSLILDFFKRLSKFNFRNRYAYILIIFLCFLIMPTILYKVFYDKFDHTNYENRKFATKPKFELKKFDNYPKLYETYFNDYIPFRNELNKLKNLLDIICFNNSTSKQVLVGKDKWLFFIDKNWADNLGDPLKFYMGLNYYSYEELEVIKNNIIKIREYLNNKNIEFSILITPEQKEVYYEYMPDYINKAVSNRTEILVNYLKKYVNILYPKKYFLDNKNLLNTKLYYKYDLHWNGFGGFIGTQELLKFLNMKTNSIIEIKTNYNVSGVGARLLSLSNYFDDDEDYYVVVNTNKIEYKKYNDYVNVAYNIKSDNTNKLLIIGDSFAGQIFRYIPNNFSETYNSHFSKFKNECIDIIKPNYIVFVLLEYRELNLYYNSFFRK